MTFKKSLISLFALSALLVGCSEQNEKEIAQSNSKSEVAITSQIEESDKKDTFIVDEQFEKIFKETINEENKYTFIRNMNVKENVVTLDVMIEDASFENAINRINSAVSLTYALSKSDERTIKDFKITIYTKDMKSYETNVNVDELKVFLSEVGEGIDAEVKMDLYDTLNIVSFIEAEYPKEYTKLSQVKVNEVEVMRNKGETDKLFTDDKLFNIDKISNNSFRKVITNKKLSMSNIHLEKNNIVGDINLDTKQDVAKEISKVIDAFGILYSFSDFESSITNLEVYIYNNENKEIGHFVIKATDYEVLLTKTKDDNAKLSKELSEVIDLKPLIKKFNK